MAYSLISIYWIKLTDVSLISILIIFCSTTIAAENLDELENVDDYDDVCYTSGCKEAAKIIKENMDEKVNPCDDFYSFACGGFANNTKIPPNKAAYNRLIYIKDKVSDEVQNLLKEKIDPNELRIFTLVKKFYKACMDLPLIDRYGLKPLQDIIDKLGGWPVVVGDAWNENEFDWTEIDFKLRQIGFHPKSIFYIFVFNDVYNATRNLLYIEPLITHINIAALKKGPLNSVVKAYHNFMVDVAVALGAKKKKAEHELRSVIELIRNLTNFISEDESAANITLASIHDLQEHAPFINWSKYINGITEPILSVEEFNDIRIKNKHYLIKVVHFLNTVPKRTLANYMIWKAIAELVPHLNKRMRNIDEKFIILSTNHKNNLNRGQQCMEWINKRKALTIGVSSLYLRKYFNNATKAAIRPILHSMVDEFKNVFMKSPWLDHPAKEATLRKIDYMKRIIAYPNELLNDTILENYAQGLEIHPDDHFQNILNLNRFHFDYAISGLVEKTDKRLWILLSDTTSVNAFYYALSNAFALLAGILQPPMFNYNWPYFSKFGSMGFIIGHEMMHAYDPKNSNFDETGSYNPLLLETVSKEYTKHMECYINQYNQYVDKNIGLNVDGNKTLNENLADAVGMKISFYAYKRWKQDNEVELKLPGLKYTPDQLFWITSVNFLCSKTTDQFRLELFSTDEHTADNFRAIGALSNSNTFARTFNCPLGSRMNPESKCNFW